MLHFTPLPHLFIRSHYSSTNSTCLKSIQPHCDYHTETHLSIARCSCTERNRRSFKTEGGFKPGLPLLRVRRSTAELLRSTHLLWPHNFYNCSQKVDSSMASLFISVQKIKLRIGLELLINEIELILLSVHFIGLELIICKTYDRN